MQHSENSECIQAAFINTIAVIMQHSCNICIYSLFINAAPPVDILQHAALTNYLYTLFGIKIHSCYEPYFLPCYTCFSEAFVLMLFSNLTIYEQFSVHILSIYLGFEYKQKILYTHVRYLLMQNSYLCKLERRCGSFCWKKYLEMYSLEGNFFFYES